MQKYAGPFGNSISYTPLPPGALTRGLKLVLIHCMQPEGCLSGSKLKSEHTMEMCQKAWECHGTRADVGREDGKLGTV